jgi:hypothetical protein
MDTGAAGNPSRSARGRVIKKTSNLVSADNLLGSLDH